MSSDSFPQFPKLPAEIQNQIWEETCMCSGPRIIEAAMLTEDGDMGLRLTCTLGTALEQQVDFSARIVEEPALEDCPDPAALQACHASRAHALISYKTLTHRHLPDDLQMVYFNPHMDALWLSTDVTDSIEIIEELRDAYDSDLDKIEYAFVNEWMWTEHQEKEEQGTNPEWVTTHRDALSAFGGIHTVTVVMDLSEQDRYQEHAQMLKSTDERLNYQRRWTVKYIDADQNMYAILEKVTV